VQRQLGEFEERGARVVAVGQGTGAEAARIARMLKVTYPCLGDPEHESYRALSLGRAGWWGLLAQPFFESPGPAIRNLRQADLRASASPRSDVKQLGGALVVDPRGTVRFLHRSRTTTDVPATADLLAAVDAVLRG
jgi:hypothetical protein